MHAYDNRAPENRHCPRTPTGNSGAGRPQCAPESPLRRRTRMLPATHSAIPATM